MLEAIHQEIDRLPPEAQAELLTIIRDLKQRYSSPPEPRIKNYQNFKKIGLIGCCSTEQNLSTNYKKILAQEWSRKHDNR